MNIIDKAAWQIDGGIDKADVESHFKTIFNWLQTKGMLTAEGKEFLDTESYSEASINDRVVDVEGFAFLMHCYDEYISKVAFNSDKDASELTELYMEYCK